MTVFETNLRVRYQETDQMGVVYHANYLTWFEVGRTEFIRHAGYPYSSFEERGILLPVLRANLHYKTPARYDDEVIVRTMVKNFSGVRITFGYEIVHKQSEGILVTGETEHVWVNKQFRPINLKKVWPEVANLIESFVVEHS